MKVKGGSIQGVFPGSVQVQWGGEGVGEVLLEGYGFGGGCERAGGQNEGLRELSGEFLKAGEVFGVDDVLGQNGLGAYDGEGGLLAAYGN